MNNLYTFSRRAWFFRFLDWTYGINSANTFRTFCPVFWLLVFTIALYIIPIIPIVKLFGKLGTTALDNARTYSYRKEEKIKKDFIEKYSDSSKLTDEECFDLVNSKCWKKYAWNGLPQEARWNIQNREDIYDNKLKKERRDRKDKQREQYQEVKQTKWFAFVSLLITGSIICLFIYFFYKLFSSIEFKPIDWQIVKIMILGTITILISMFILYLIFKYTLKPLFRWISCIKLPKCRLCKFNFSWMWFPFAMLAKGIVIVCDMIHATYKKRCPIITLKD